jgi:hypothetical protein
MRINDPFPNPNPIPIQALELAEANLKTPLTLNKEGETEPNLGSQPSTVGYVGL